ncbi:hypothetical protein LCGC14_0709350 [marine sediment metagenome]|uniref:Uncharacterized protein n=1 Tax=marine sediment metagenome TaxID=412755 RepID=A0A0F9TN29_9ZZZZ
MGNHRALLLSSPYLTKPNPTTPYPTPPYSNQFNRLTCP